MFRRLKAVYGAGFRSGSFGSYLWSNPYDNFLLAYAWKRGWLKGSRQRNTKPKF